MRVLRVSFTSNRVFEDAASESISSGFRVDAENAGITPLPALRTAVNFSKSIVLG